MQQPTRQIDEFRSRCQARHAAVAVEVGTDAYMLDTHHIDHMVQVFNGIEDGGAAVRAQETVVESNLRHSVLGRQGAQLVVSEVARMVAESAG